ncbi:MAG TPA: hypothetical protein VKY36_05555 [Moheibacter sp.]|nr:hypothetical protein [Moheibacter sp.]
MKKLLLLFVAAITLVSCQITERFYLQESGMVKYETEINFSEMMAFMYDEPTKDSLRQIGEYPIDTLLNFADLEDFDQISPDSISDAQLAFMRSMDKTKVHMVMNDTEGKMIMRIEEKNINALNDYLKETNTALAKLEKEDPAAAAEMGQSGLMKSLEFKFDGKNFQRIAMNQNDFLNELDDSTAEATRQMMNMFEYKMEYHFPKRVKNTSLENATFSIDGKTMTIDVPMSELLENTEKYNFTVELE